MAEESIEVDGASGSNLEYYCSTLCTHVKSDNSTAQLSRQLANNLVDRLATEKRSNFKFFLDKDSSALPDVLTALETCNDDMVVFALSKCLEHFIGSGSSNVVKLRRLRRLSQVNGSHYLIKSLVNVINRTPSDHRALTVDTLVFVLLSLAKKDKKFALRVRLTGLLRILANQISLDSVGKSTALLALLAYCSRSARNATFLSKQKNVIEHVLNCLQNTRLDVELLQFYCELLFFISRNKKCRPKLIGLDAVRILISLFRWCFERRNEHSLLDICEIAAGCMRQMAKSKNGKERIISLDGLVLCEQSIKILSAEIKNEQNGFDTCKLQSVLCAVCLACLPARPYPLVNVPHPVQFKLPTLTGSPTKSQNSGEDSSESDEDEDKLDVLGDGPDIENMSEDEGQDDEILPLSTDPKPTELAIFKQFFTELEVGADPSAVVWEQQKSVKGLKLAKLFSRNVESKNEKSMAQEAAETKSAIKFVKLALPDLIDGYADLPLQPMRPFPHAYRDTVVSELERYRATQQNSSKVVFDLDALVRQQSQQKNSSLDNFDLQRIGKKDPNCDTLKFESRFESGNLRRAIQISPYNYELLLRPDINESRLNHLWFYFELSNMEAEVPYTFEVSNCLKSYSMFASGMQPLLFSVTEAADGRPGWVRSGHGICYYRNLYSMTGSKKKTADSKALYTARFTIIFRHPYDVCYLAYHFPYTYTYLKSNLSLWRQMADPSDVYYRTDLLCSSLAGNPVYLVTITAAGSIEEIRERDIIVLSARVHPAESNSSWMMHGAIKFLLGANDKATALRQAFVFKIVPMLNPDGVINGCSRCSLCGVDLNRQWSEPSPVLHPTIFHTKGLIQYLNEIGRKPLVYCDMHGHSRRCNVFIFGNNPQESWFVADHGKEHQFEFMTLPEILDKEAPGFDLSNCRFAIQKTKEPSARVVVWRRLEIIRAYTMEATYCGFDKGRYTGFQVGTRELGEMGRCFCEALLSLKESINVQMQRSESKSVQDDDQNDLEF